MIRYLTFCAALAIGYSAWFMAIRQPAPVPGIHHVRIGDPVERTAPELEEGNTVGKFWLARSTWPKERFPILPEGDYRLVVKFQDELLARADRGFVVSAGGNAVLDEALASTLSQEGVVFEQLLDLSEETIQFLELRGAAISGIASPDLAGMMVVHAPRQVLPSLAAELFFLPQVEWIEFMEWNPPPPAIMDDVPPVTPNYVPLQGYHQANPGLNMAAFWALGNARGAGIRIADCEYGFNTTHEDLPAILSEANQTPVQQVYTNNWHQHGTAVFGEMISGDNGYGTSGLSPEAQGYFFPEWTVQGGSRRTTCIANAIAAVLPGDIVLLEMQTTQAGASGFGPAELSQSVWTVVRTGVNGGVVVVGAAGNGNQNLDAAEYDAYRARGDSGAIIVGAGSADSTHTKLSFSTYGSRVNVQGWGQSVFSTGYGGHAVIGNDPNQNYTATFSGTSSASPFIASACASLQSYAIADIGRRLTPLQLRQTLLNTGHNQQGAGGNIGKFPNLVEAANYVTAQWGAPQSPPSSSKVALGTNLLGSISSLASSDDNRFCVDSVLPESDAWARKIPTVQFTASIPVPNPQPGRWGLRLEGHGTAANINRRVEIYNFQESRYQVVDSRFCNVGADQITRIEINQPLGRFRDPVSNQLLVRVTCTQSSKLSGPSWKLCLDQLAAYFAP